MTAPSSARPKDTTFCPWPSCQEPLWVDATDSTKTYAVVETSCPFCYGNLLVIGWQGLRATVIAADTRARFTPTLTH